ncbi:Gp37-like protein [Arthrobacter agilis]|uniref:Gp37-like protein n=1 Tax=Arthrobacter agilis TaxID=37921 RepID=UPI00277FE33B|nr:hypothetical protein [Arthrobacter agilis]MDQ0735337.1 hypothetical protein [Arthrobacter agilis]
MFQFAIFDRNYQWRAPLGSVTSLKATIRHNAISEATFSIPANHKRAGMLIEPGTRLRIRYRGEHLISGPVRLASGSSEPPRTLEFSVQSDFRLLSNFLGWPAPMKAITQQGDDGAYWTMRDNAESVVKAAARQNILHRSEYPLTVAPDQSRGGLVDVSLRMHPLFDRLFPAVDAAGIGVSVEMIPGGLLLDCYVPKVRVTKLTEQSRVVRKWQFSRAAPEATRGVIGAQGSGDLREFIPFASAAREAEWGDVIEVFQDARDTADSVTHAMRGQEALNETAPVATLTVDLAESNNFRIFGPKGVKPGDIVTAVVGPGIEVTDVVREVSLDWSRSNGLSLSAVIGPKDDPMEQLMKAITTLARGVTDLRVGT